MTEERRLREQARPSTREKRREERATRERDRRTGREAKRVPSKCGVDRSFPAPVCFHTHTSEAHNSREKAAPADRALIRCSSFLPSFPIKSSVAVFSFFPLLFFPHPSPSPSLPPQYNDCHQHHHPRAEAARAHEEPRAQCHRFVGAIHLNTPVASMWSFSHADCSFLPLSSLHLSLSSLHSVIPSEDAHQASLSSCALDQLDSMPLCFSPPILTTFFAITFRASMLPSATSVVTTSLDSLDLLDWPLSPWSLPPSSRTDGTSCRLLSSWIRTGP